MSTRSVRQTRCAKCKAPTLSGLSEDWLAFPALVDPGPLDAVGEALAHLGGRRTYALRRHTGRSLRLYQRDRWQITGKPPGSRSIYPFDVVADHACGLALPVASSQLSKPSAPPQGASHDLPPF